MTADIVRRRVVIEGRVQGVGYRVACARTARAHGLTGSVHNRPDHRVEAVFEGPAGRVDDVIAWCRIGPSYADVTRVKVTEELPKGETAFVIA